MSAQTNIHAEYLTELRALARESSQLLLLEQCPQGNYSVRCSSGAGREMFMYPQVKYYQLFKLLCMYYKAGKMYVTHSVVLADSSRCNILSDY